LAQHIKGDTVILELVSVGKSGGAGFGIDEYVAGYASLAQVEATCGDDDKRNTACYQDSHPSEYERGRAVARLLINGSSLCTGWLASSESHLITNEHCIGSALDALNTDYEFLAEAPDCGSSNCQLCWPGTVFSGATLIQYSSNLDYALVQINSGDPAATYGYLEIDNRVAVVGEQIYIPQHPGGRAKEFAIESTDPCDTGGVCRVNTITASPCSGSGYNDVGYYADTEGGSSGSPVLATSSHKVIALHHCANCPNRGVPIHLIYDEISDHLFPGAAGKMALDKNVYSCSDVVEIEVRDGDLGNNGTQPVDVTTTGGDSETVVLAETGASTAVFTGTIATSTDAVVSTDGVLQVADGQTITVTYNDADGGSGNPAVVQDSAEIDCVAPVISNVAAGDDWPAIVTFDTDEASCSTVRFGLSCGALTGETAGLCGQTSHSVTLSEVEPNTAYFYSVEVEDEAGNTTADDNSGDCYTFTTPPLPDDYFTELFDAGDNDLDNLSITLTPDGSINFYSACVESITELPTDPLGGIRISLGDDAYRELPPVVTVSLFGHDYGSGGEGSIYVGSNGYITFGASDTDYTESIEDHFRLPRISALFDDLNPSAGGVVTAKKLRDRLAISWVNVPEYNSSTTNTFQIEMFFDGMIRISWLDIAADDGLAGISAGEPTFFVESDISAYGSCGQPIANSGPASTSVDTPVDITLEANDDGQPDPPGELSYIIVTLPANGLLRDPGLDTITAVPHTLVGGGNVVTYTPDPLYVGSDSFDFKVNDGGTPPDGGDSDIATISIDVGECGADCFPDTDPQYPQWVLQGKPRSWCCDGQPFGDATGDGIADFADLTALRNAKATAWATHPHGTSEGEYNCAADFNHDGVIDLPDLTILKDNALQTVGSPCADISDCGPNACSD